MAIWPFAVNEPNTFAGLQAKVKAIAGFKRGYAFRGYHVPKSDDVKEPRALKTGLERVSEEIDGGLEHAMRHEAAVVREFMRRAHHYLDGVPGAKNWIEWLALMQHHGAPTRLLDWTYSLHAATYFAIKHASREPGSSLAIWTVNTHWCRDASRALCGKAGMELKALHVRPFRRLTEIVASQELLLGRLPACVWPVNPFRLNERLTVQKGLFLAAADATKSFATNLRALPEHQVESNLICFVIPHTEIPDIARKLDDANVSETTLFPGVDGFARSLWLSAHYLDLEGIETLADI